LKERKKETKKEKEKEKKNKQTNKQTNKQKLAFRSKETFKKKKYTTPRCVQLSINSFPLIFCIDI
jgi:hypothetical protein